MVMDSATAVGNIFRITWAVHFYPDPVKDVLFFESVEPIRDIEIYGIVGGLVVRASPMAVDCRLSLGLLTPGLYLVKVNGLFAGRFVKE